ncbi:glycosyltransferase family 2 protein [Mesorhizobium sp. M2D.F.Ca.ET.185.01.1.1]|uniref:glycosyltransferase family 2 protein n=1 Tax=unclassified Mesorhizobium TaxID=325217 RepID=UPI000FCAF0F2|nr:MULTISPECIES: glycosyltransferase family A protein [unclassified Mesorhizobium]TGP82183.1 glycosyltransferase family 2 protein [bacterium M00.F.Ca.ET.227.01.1.1]TGP91933.1 glycosyltransferase family 2 protein [bacterium M00.F.Ca.ET.221.01.1.1]TGP95281.1 glycosyltransferase family 2 protein [bacterium M00.F.Ca.ET.222.01.1.1]TGU09615.1 glycosyltransferase family 2 protein [bacterium M00.F.Ca.ET.163.01.1.1]TGU38789.1 glycosyltransferase family 2 protein [bacterium M00.F.Ca.ET.156.01.1.1]TGU47
MRLSVIMPVHNRESYVGAALRSLLRQRNAAELDIIVIDDGSRDGSAEAVRAMMDEAPCIRLFQQENMGVTRARNSGLRQLRPETELVSFLDSDDISPAGRFEADLNLFRKDPSLELTYSRMMLVDRIDEETLEPTSDSNSITVRGIHLSAAIFSRGLVDQIGGFDEDFIQAEDTDFLLRSFEIGPRYVLPDTLALYYRRHAGNMTRQQDVQSREFMRAVYKSMKRRRADPSLKPIEGIFELKKLADWQFN